MFLSTFLFTSSTCLPCCGRLSALDVYTAGAESSDRAVRASHQSPFGEFHWPPVLVNWGSWKSFPCHVGLNEPTCGSDWRPVGSGHLIELLPELLLWLQVSEFGLGSFVYGSGTGPLMWPSLKFLGLWCFSTKSLLRKSSLVSLAPPSLSTLCDYSRVSDIGKGNLCIQLCNVVNYLFKATTSFKVLLQSNADFSLTKTNSLQNLGENRVLRDLC